MKWHRRRSDDPAIEKAVSVLLTQIAQLNNKADIIMATQAEHAAELQAISAQVAKIGSESAATLEAVAALEAALANAGNTSPEVDAAMAALRAQVQIVDDLVPDA